MEVVSDTNHEPTGSGSSASFTNVLVSLLDESGQSKPKYTFPVTLVAEYDPEVSQDRLQLSFRFQVQH
jgi:hypothetical protein